MRHFLHLILLVLFAANAAGCGSNSSEDSIPPPGLVKNPQSPDPNSIKTRRQMLIEQQKGSVPSRFVGKR
jgi:hypothetical protein